MGSFSLCVEATTCDINALLALHKVHPQVRADVKRRLNILVEKSYEEMTMLQPGYEESSEQVCHAIASDILNRTFSIAIPTSELALAEQRCSELYQEVRDLTGAVEQYQSRFNDMELVVEDLKKAHEYMLHSYFREVLMLRNQIYNDNRNAPRRSKSLATTLPTPRLSTSHTIADASRRGYRAPTFEGQQLLGDSPPEAPSATQDHSASEYTTTALGYILLHANKDLASANNADSDEPPLPLRPPLARPEDTNVHATEPRAPSQQHNEAPPPTLTAHRDWALWKPGPNSPRADAVAAASHAPEGAPAPAFPTNKKMEDNREMLKAIGSRKNSVDAIFDYESYIALLNGKGGEWDDRYEKLSVENRALKRKLQSERVRARIGLKFSNMSRNQTADIIQQQLDAERARNNKFWWLFHLAIELIRENFLELIRELREELQLLQKEHQDFIMSIQTALGTTQHRADTLLDYFLTFVEQTNQIIACIKHDAASQSRSELLLQGAIPSEALLKNFFKQQRDEEFRVKPLARMQGTALPESYDPLVTYSTKELAFWGTHPITKGALAAFSDLHSLAEKLRARRVLHFENEIRLKNKREHPGRSHLQTVKFTGEVAQPDLPSRVSSGGAVHDDTAKSSPSTEDIVGDDAQMTAIAEGSSQYVTQDLLRELMHLRWRRVVNRARCNTCTKTLDCVFSDSGPASAATTTFEYDNSDSRNSCSQSGSEIDIRVMMLKKVREMAEEKIEKDTIRIDELLRLLGRDPKEFGAVEKEEPKVALVPEEPVVAPTDWHELMESPYWLDVQSKASSVERPYGLFDDANSTYYIPVGMPGTGSGIPSYVTFKDQRIPISAFFTDEQRFGAGTDTEHFYLNGIPKYARTKGQARTPHAAVMAYCRGVQIGAPIGKSRGPVYLKYDEVSDGYYVADENGSNLLLDAEAEASNSASEALYFGSNRCPMPMTQIIFPAPRPSSLGEIGIQPTDTADTLASGPYVYCYDSSAAPIVPSMQNNTATQPLRPMYLVPMTVPVPQGINALRSAGRTADSTLYVTSSTVPLAASHTHLLSSRQQRPPFREKGWGGATHTSARGGRGGANPYYASPPRVCRPATEEQTMLSIKAATISIAGPAPSAPPHSISSDPATTHSTFTFALDHSPLPTPLDAKPVEAAAAPDDGNCGAAAAFPACAPNLTVPTGVNPAAGDISPNETHATAAAATVVQTALAKAKLARGARLEREAQQQQSERDQRKEEWLHRGEVAEPTKKEKFLRLRLPRLNPLQSPSALPAPLEATRLQQQIRPPTLGGRADGWGVNSHTANRTPPPIKPSETSSGAANTARGGEPLVRRALNATH